MRKLFTFLFAALMSAGMWAAPAPCGPSLSWNLAGGVLTISGTGAMYDFDDYKNPAPWSNSKGSITSVSISDGVTTIGTYAFSGFKMMTSVSLPEGLTSIGEGAFYGDDNASFTTITFPSTLTSIGNNAFGYCSGLTSITIPNSVTSIGEWAFYGCEGLTSELVIPNSVTSIGESAFYACSGLTSITIPTSVTSIGNSVFWGCEGLASITIPNSVTSIGTEAFYSCAGLTGELVIPNSVTSIGESAFYGCSGLTSVTIPNSVTSIGGSAFSDCSGLTSITIPSSVTSIGADAFYNSTNIANVYCYPNAANLTWNEDGKDDFIKPAASKVTRCHVPSNYYSAYVTKFDATVNVTFVGDLPATVAVTGVTLDQNEAQMTVGGETLTLTATVNPEGATDKSVSWSTSDGNVATVDNGVVTAVAAGNATITVTTTDGAYTATCDVTVTAPAPQEPEIVEGVQIGNLYYNLNVDNKTAEVTYQELMSETNYSYLTTVNIPESVEYNSVTYSVTSIGLGAFLGCTGLTSITIPSSVTSIGMGAFQSCEGLTSIEIPNSVTSIGDAAFYGCIGLTSVTIGNSVTSIGMGAFLYCTDLTSVTIGNSVKSIGEYAFEGCSNLASVTILAESLESYGSGAFDDTHADLKIYVPAGSVATYKAGWAAYEDKIVAIPAPTPQGQEITPYVDPQNASVYYSTFYDSANKYALPENVEAYVATIGENVLNLTKIAEAGQVIPNDNAVILKSSVTPITLSPSEADAVTFTVDNDLLGTDEEKATPADCYVLSGEDGVVGFYQYNGTKLNPHKAYVLFSGSNAPRRMPFIFDAATGVENVRGNVQSTKVIENGQLIIIRDGVRYNAQGQIVK